VVQVPAAVVTVVQTPQLVPQAPLQAPVARKKPETQASHLSVAVVPRQVAQLVWIASPEHSAPAALALPTKASRKNNMVDYGFMKD